MLKFVCGRACTGKTSKIISNIADESNERKVILIVPEQFSFESERSIVRSENANLDNISVLSFTRLFNEVVDKVGRGAYSCVTDFEKIIMMRKAIKSCQDILEVFGGYVDNKEIPAKLYEAICEIKYAGASSDDLLNAASKIGGMVGTKLRDIAIIMSTYDALMSDRYIDPADVLTKLFEILCDVNYFDGVSVYFDSFTGFTGQQYKIISKIIEQAHNVTFAFTTDNPDNLSIGLFYNVNNAIVKIKNIARHNGVDNFGFELLQKQFYSNDSMRNLEALITDNVDIESSKSLGNVNLISCENPRDEALAAANIIRTQVEKYNYRFRDFILVARNADLYANNVSRQCELNYIPCFMDKSVNLFDTPLCIYLNCLFDAVKSFSTENILKFIKLKLIDLTDDEISVLEDYVYIWDIKGVDWKNEWVMSINGLQTDNDNECDIQKLKEINKTREKIISLIFEFKESFVGTPKQRAKAVYNHLINYKIDDNLSTLCEKFDSYENSAYSSILKQSWDKVISILDSVVRVLGHDSISNEEFVSSFEIACNSAKISNIPQMLDEVTFGSADRIRPSKPKVSIIMGANQGVFPQISSKNGILTAADKEKLEKYDIIIDDGTIKGAIEENYLIYSMLCCPTDKVFVLFSRKSMGCDELEPSSFVDKIDSYFYDLSIKDFKFSTNGEFAPKTKESAFAEIGRFKGKEFAEIKDSLQLYNEYSDKLNLIENAKTEPDFCIDTEYANKLFGSNLKLSATKFDNYHRCSLSYFIKSGLRANVIRKADLNVLQRGTIVHYVLEKIVDKYHGDLAKLSEIQISSEVDTLISDYFHAVNGSEMLMTARFAYLLSKISSSVKQIVYHLSREFAQSGFVPAYCELSIGENSDIPQLVVKVNDNSKVVLDGKIDRVDVFENNVRVVDYKTGKLKFELSDTLYGLNMQMLLYLYAFIKNGNKLVDNPKPAGILYMPAKTSANSKLRMNGLIISDENVRNAMEKDNNGEYVPKYKDGSSDYADNEMFDLIFNKIDKLIKNMGSNVLAGKFAANPTDGVHSDACKYCDFSSICRSAGTKHEKVEKIPNNQVLEILKSEVNN